LGRKAEALEVAAAVAVKNQAISSGIKQENCVLQTDFRLQASGFGLACMPCNIGNLK